MSLSTFALPAGLHVRPSSASDQPFLLELYKSTRTDLDCIQADKEFIDELKHSQFKAQTAGYGEQYPNAMSFVIEYQGHKVGRAILDFGSVEILLVDISLIPEARGKGLGSAVIRSFILCSEQTQTPLVLSVLTENTAAKILYQRLGFTFQEQRHPRDYLAYYPKTQKVRLSA